MVTMEQKTHDDEKHGFLIPSKEEINSYEIQQNINNNRFLYKSAKNWREYMLITGYVNTPKAIEHARYCMAGKAHPEDFRLIRRDKAGMIHVIIKDMSKA